MKDQLLDRPPTIGDCRRQGVVEIEVRCRRPCKRIGLVAIEALRLPDDTMFRAIPTLRRLRCSQCDRLVADVSPIYPPPKIGEPGPARWMVVIKQADGPEAFSSPLWSRELALQFAKRLIESGDKVARIEGPTGIIDADEITAWCCTSHGPSRW